MYLGGGVIFLLFKRVSVNIAVAPRKPENIA
jgi:hypothetical protein